MTILPALVAFTALVGLVALFVTLPTLGRLCRFVARFVFVGAVLPPTSLLERAILPLLLLFLSLLVLCKLLHAFRELFFD